MEQKVKNKIKELLNSKSLKATRTRKDVLQEVVQNKKATPYSNIQKAMRDTDRVTLYRTMETLLGNGIIHEAYRQDSEVYYAVCNSNCSNEKHVHQHLHFMCKQCETVSCIDIKESIKPQLPDIQIEQFSISATGLCQNCLATI